MILIVFAVLTIIGQLLNVGLCLLIDQVVSPMAGALTFVALYMLVFAGAWVVTLRLAGGWQLKADALEQSR